MNRRPVLVASVVALMELGAWWGALLWLDGAIAAALPYRQYETVALFYPGVFYPALPGWMLAHVQPFTLGVYVVTLGWMVALSAAIGYAAAKVAPRYEVSPPTAATALVAGLFVALTVAEAAAALVA